MDTGRTVKIIRNVPAPIPVEFPKSPGKKQNGDTSDAPTREVTPQRILTPSPSTPIRKEEEVPV